MFWWFERGGELLRVEVLHLETNVYELRIISADGSAHIETFDSAHDLAKRQQLLMRSMAATGWTGPHGWVM